MHLDKPGATLTRMTPDQTDDINVSVDGPYRPDHYRY
ncbi:adenosylhomocysteinase [Desulforhopalus vacuolatus]|nr:adenosylhomocysteinase [Desulforhopalus vacuolatus]